MSSATCPKSRSANGQPEEATAFIERVVECNHWDGEEPYDKERAEQIRRAVEKARCYSLNIEEQALERAYKGNKKVLRVMGRLRGLSIRTEFRLDFKTMHHGMRNRPHFPLACIGSLKHRRGREGCGE
jgi:hypothetical protein